MYEEPLVSVIMAAFNAEKTIKEAIQSVIEQTYKNWELLIVNDCSRDRTESLVTGIHDARIHLLNNEHNVGVSLTRKRGLDAAKGEWIAILDSDDAWAPDKLEKQIMLSQKSAAKLIFTGSAFMDSDGRYIDWQLHVPEKLNYQELLKQNLISNSSVLVKADLYRRHYAIGDNMHEDFAIWLGITKEGEQAYGIDEPLLIYRLANASKSSNKLNAARMNWKTYRYIGLSYAETIYYMGWYIVNGLRKYSHLR